MDECKKLDCDSIVIPRWPTSNDQSSNSGDIVKLVNGTNSTRGGLDQCRFFIRYIVYSMDAFGIPGVEVKSRAPMLKCTGTNTTVYSAKPPLLVTPRTSFFSQNVQASRRQWKHRVH